MGIFQLIFRPKLCPKYNFRKTMCSCRSSLILLQILIYPLPFPSFPQIKNNPYRKIIIPSLPHPTTSPKKETEKKKPLLFLFSPPFLRSNTIPLLSHPYHIRATLTPLYLPHKPTSPIPHNPHKQRLSDLYN